MVRLIGRFAYLLLVVVLAAPFAISQIASTGEIKGTVTDASGAVVPGVKVTATNVQTGVSTEVITNSVGIYYLASVAKGKYRIAFAKDGFRQLVRDGVTVQQQTLVIDVTLAFGAISEQVVITAEAPLLQTATSNVETHFSTEDVHDAPNTSGVWFNSLTKVLPGVSQSGDGVAVNGMQNYSATFYMEGANTTMPRDVNASNNYPPMDAIAEVDVNVANGGSHSGYSPLTLNVGLKSGTNQWHGSAYEWIQNDFFNARGFFNAPISAPGFNTSCTQVSPGLCKKAPLRWNEYGGSFGGPIIKDKLFFFATYQRNPISGSGLYTAAVPTPAMLNGDFSDPRFPLIYDRTTGQPFPGNKIPADRIDPVAAKIASWWSRYFQPNRPSSGGVADGNYAAIISTPSTNSWLTTKIDYNLSAKHRLAGSFFTLPTHVISNADAFCSQGLDCTVSTPNNRNSSIRISETWTVSTQAVNEFRLGFVRERDVYQGGTFGTDILNQLGIEPKYGSNATAPVFPTITIDPLAGATGRMAFNGGAYGNLVQNVYNASDVFSLVRGKHTIKIGGELNRLFQHDQGWGNNDSGNFNFSGVSTAHTDSANPSLNSSGVPFADFLLGDVYGWYVYNAEPTNTASWLTAAYVQDDFKVTPRVTVNAGLRWQHQTGWAVADGRFANFNPSLPNPGVPGSSFPSNPNCRSGPNCLGALEYGKIDGHNTIVPSVNSLTPRIGVAWSPRDKWSIRASYGMFEMFRNSETYARDNGNNSNLGYGFTPNGNLGNNAGQIAFQLQNGPPPNSVFYPTVSNLTAGSFNGSVIGYYPRPVPLSYMQQFVISVQRELLGRQIMDVSYVHTKGTHLPFTTDRNQIPVANWLDTNPNNTGVSGAARPYPWYESILEHDFNGWSNYDALQVRFLKNYSSGVSYQFNYTYSKMMDTGSQGGHNSLLTSPWQIAGDPRANYARSDLDFPHSFNGQITYELPVGAGRQFAVRGLLDKIAGGWRLSSIMTAHSGTPYTVLYSVPSMSDYTGAGVCGCNFSLYPNRTGSGTLSNPTAQQWFDPSAFSLPNFVTTTVTTSSGTVTYDQFAPGNSGRNTLRGPRFWSADLSIAKAFRIRDRVTLEIRADSLNFFNHTNLSVANLNRTIAFVKNAAGQYVVSPDNTGGQITNTVVPPGGNFANGGARMFQLGGRISF